MGIELEITNLMGLWFDKPGSLVVAYLRKAYYKISLAQS